MISERCRGGLFELAPRVMVLFWNNSCDFHTGLRLCSSIQTYSPFAPEQAHLLPSNCTRILNLCRAPFCAMIGISIIALCMGYVCSQYLHFIVKPYSVNYNLLACFMMKCRIQIWARITLNKHLPVHLIQHDMDVETLFKYFLSPLVRCPWFV